VALPVAHAEASIKPLTHRWRGQALRTWINLHTLHHKHPFWKSKRRIDLNNKRFVSPLQTYAQWFRAVNLDQVETIQAYCVPPWHDGVKVNIEEREKAIEEAMASMADLHIEPIFTDASVRGDLTGIAVVTPRFRFNQTIGTTQDLNTHFAELFAIFQAVKNVEQYTQAYRVPVSTNFVVFSDSQAALKSLSRPRQQSGQYIITSILGDIENMRARGGPDIALRWVPAHAGVPLNEQANSLARAATERGRLPMQPFLRRLRTVTWHNAQKTGRGEEWSQSDHSFFARQVDQALPGRHTRRLYDHLTKTDAGILAQLRSGKCRLNHYLARINAVDSEQCDCGQGPETVGHFLFKCPRWSSQREDMKRIAPGRYGDLTFWIGGWSNRRLPDGKYIDGNKNKWRPNMKAVTGTLDFVKSTKRFDPEQE
jgi:ribonuclease HI